MGEIQQLADALQLEYSVSLAVVFGSVATGNAGSNSDLDLVVDGDLAGFQVFDELRHRLQLAVARDLDLVHLADARQAPTNWPKPPIHVEHPLAIRIVPH